MTKTVCNLFGCRIENPLLQQSSRLLFALREAASRERQLQAAVFFVSVGFLSGFARAGTLQEPRSRFSRLSVSSCGLLSALPAVSGE